MLFKEFFDNVIQYYTKRKIIKWFDFIFENLFQYNKILHIDYIKLVENTYEIYLSNDFNLNSKIFKKNFCKINTYLY